MKRGIVGLIRRRQLEQPPIGGGEALEEFADFQVIGRHQAHARDQFLADVFGDGLLVNLGGEMVTALGGILVEGTLEQVQGALDLAVELGLAELESVGWFAHKYAYIYAYNIPRKISLSRGEAKKICEKEDLTS